MNRLNKRLARLERLSEAKQEERNALEDAKRLVRYYLISKQFPERLTAEGKDTLARTEWETIQDAHGLVWQASRAAGNKGDLDTTLRFAFTR